MTKHSDSFIVTQNEGQWELHETDVLNNYAIKTESKQLDEKDLFKDIDGVLSPLYDPSKLNELLELNTWHERCVDAIAGDIAGQGWSLKPKTGIENPNEDQKKLIEEFLHKLRPSIIDLIYKKRYDERANGNGVWEIIRTNGRESPLYNIKHIPSHTIRRLNDGIRAVQKVGAKKVYFVIMGKNKTKIAGHDVYFDVHYKTGEISYKKLPESERANEIIFTKIYTPRTKFYGNPKIVPAIRVIYGDINRANYNADFFKNYGVPAFAVTVTGDFDPGPEPDDEDYKEEKTLKYKISKQLKEVIKNPHSAVTILIPSEGEEGNVEVKLEPLSVDIKEASFRLYRKDNRDEIIAAHGVDPSRLGISEAGKLNGTNSEELDSSYKTSLIKPGQRREEEDFNYYILNLGFNITDWEFKLLDNDPRNIKKDWDMTKEAFETGFITRNEGRDFVGEYFGLEATDDIDGDSFYYHGQPMGSPQTDPKGANAVLTGLENDLQELDDDVSNKSDDSYKNSPLKRIITAVKEARRVS